MFARHDLVFRRPAGLQEAGVFLCSSCLLGCAAMLGRYHMAYPAVERISQTMEGGGIKGAGSLGLGLWLAKPAAPLLHRQPDCLRTSVIIIIPVSGTSPCSTYGRCARLQSAYEISIQTCCRPSYTSRPCYLFRFSSLIIYCTPWS